MRRRTRGTTPPVTSSVILVNDKKRALQGPMQTQHAAKRARLVETIKQHSSRRVILALESQVPEEVSWALCSLLLASAPVHEQAAVDRLGETCILSKMPGLLRALLPVALPPAHPPASCAALKPCPPGGVQTRALRMAQCRQAWLVLRNMSLMPENEAPLVSGPGSKALRRLLLHTLRRAFRDCAHEAPLTAEELASLEGADVARLAAAAELPLGTAAVDGTVGGQCAVNPLCVRGFRHGGRGGPCRVEKPAPPAAAGSGGGRGGGSASTPLPPAAAARAKPKGDTAEEPWRTGESLPAPPPAPPALGAAYEAEVHVCAAEVLSQLCRVLRLDDLEPSTPGTTLIAKEGAWEVCEVLSLLVRCAEPALSGVAVEALGRLAATDGNEAALARIVIAHPAVVGAVSCAMAEAQDAGGASGAGGGGADEAAANGLLPPALVLEGAVEVVMAWSAGPAPLPAQLSADRILIGRLIRLLGGSTPAHLGRRAAQALQRLAQSAETHHALRPPGWLLMHLGMHESLGAATYVGDVLEALSER